MITILSSSDREVASRRLALAYRRDPLDPRSWSGTPSHLADGLSEVGWSVSGITARVSPMLERAVRQQHRRFHLGPDVARNPVVRRARALTVDRAVRASRPDVVLHIGTMHLPLWRRVPEGTRHVMFIDTTWSLWSRHRANIDEYASWLRRSADRLERRAYHQMDHVFTASERARAELIEHYSMSPGRVTAVGTGLGQQLPEPPERSARGPRLLYVGKHRAHDKGLDVLLAAVERARHEILDLTLTVVGPDAHRGDLTGREGVEVRSWVQPDELARLYADADLFAMPARNEPWGLVYLEALSMGTAVLGVDRHAFPEIAGGGAYGVVVAEPTPELVANQLVAALGDRAKLAAMGAAGREAVRRTASWHRVAADITTVLESL